MTRRIWRVAELIAEVNQILRQGFAGVWVEGEVTGSTTSGRGHLYFTLKDEDASLDCVMWASRAQRLRFRLEDGLAVVALGDLTVYRQRGRFQMVVEELQPQGLGALQLAFEQLKARLAKEGLFDEARKRPLPALPQRVGIVTSPTGAALRDMLKILRRFPWLQVVVAPATVQGEGAAVEIAGALERLGASGLVDVIIVGRGGGSLEDLWAFNEEPVARAIVASPVPVISAVGHEVDFTIADFAADLRAATPTHGAELVVTRLEEQLRRLDHARDRLVRELERHVVLARRRLEALEGSAGLARLPHRIRLLRSRLDRADRLVPLLLRHHERSRTRLEHLEAALRRVPGRVAAGGHRRLLESQTHRLGLAMRSALARARTALVSHERSLGHLSPRAVLQRGYSITTLEGSSSPLRDPSGVRAGQRLVTLLAGGVLRSVATGTGETPERRRTPDSPEDVQPTLFRDDGGEP